VIVLTKAIIKRNICIVIFQSFNMNSDIKSWVDQPDDSGLNRAFEIWAE
jgi:hypothetical protein